jgi:hypothetical protein
MIAMPPRALFATLLILSGCVVARRPLELPKDEEAAIFVMSEAFPHSMSGIARHSWIAARPRGRSTFDRYEVLGSAHKQPGDPFRPQCGCGRDTPEDADVRMHAVLHGEEAERIIPCLDREIDRYNEDHEYGFWPGPNCNTFVATMARRCGIAVELPATAVGRDFRGIVGAGATSGGTGVQAESPFVGAKIGLTEGVEVHVFGGALGLDLWPPAIIVPVGPGRIGFDDR